MSSYKKTITLGLDYSEFSGGVTECNNKMKLLEEEFKYTNSQLEANGTASEKTAAKTDYLTQKIYLQQQKVEEAKKKYNALMDAQADTSKIDKADAALLKERTTLQNLQNELEETTLANSKLKESLTITATVVGGLAATYFKCAKETAEYADEILTLSNNTGIAVDTLQKLSYAADFVDVSTETVTSSLSRMVRSMDDASKGSATATEAFKKLGVKVTDTKGNLRDSETVFFEVVDALGKIENKTQRDAIAMDLFGKSAQDLSGIILAGSEGLKELGIEAEKLGAIMSSEELEKAGELDDAFQKLEEATSALGRNLGMTVVPMLTELINAIASIPAPVLTTITVILSIIATLVSLSMSINSMVKAGSSIASFFSGFGKGLDATTIKIIAITAAITALVAAIAILIGKGPQIIESLNSIGNLTGGQQRSGRNGYNANGTSYWRGGQTWVGENGPELVDLPAGTRIYNNTESKQMANKTYNINMNMDMTKVRSISDVIEAIEGLADSAGSGGEVFG